MLQASPHKLNFMTRNFLFSGKILNRNGTLAAVADIYDVCMSHCHLHLHTVLLFQLQLLSLQLENDAIYVLPLAKKMAKLTYCVSFVIRKFFVVNILQNILVLAATTK